MLPETESGEAQGQSQLLRVKSLPDLADTEEQQIAESESEYFWAGPEAAPVGNSVHAALQRIAEKGIEQWSESDTAAETERMRRRLVAEGLSGKMLASAVRRTESILHRVLTSQRGTWLLSVQHDDAHCEWELSSRHEDLVSHHIIDRSFIDDDGVRWIIDYKTASHEGGDPDAFLAEEAKRHAAQLNRYAAALRMLEPGREIRTALYFPAFDGWCEIQRQA